KASNVDDLERRIGWCLEGQQSAAPRDCPLDRVVIVRITEGAVNTPARQELQEQLAGSTIAIFDRYDPIAGAEEGKQDIADCRHTGGEACGGRRTLLLAHLLLEGTHRGIGIAVVD